MVTARIQTVKITVDHVGYPGDRVPVALMVCRKGPDNIIYGQPFNYPGIFINISAVVEIYKMIVADLKIYGKGEKCQKQTDPDLGTDVTEII